MYDLPDPIVCEIKLEKKCFNIVYSFIIIISYCVLIPISDFKSKTG